jgi:hypothetical protein
MARYLIDDDMIGMIEGECYKTGTTRPGINNCSTCPYEGKGKRKRCCDFGKSAMIDLLRSEPYHGDE